MRRSVFERLARLERQALDQQRLALARAAADHGAAEARERQLFTVWSEALRTPPQEAPAFATLASFTEASRLERRKFRREAEAHAAAMHQLLAELRERMAEVKRFELLAERQAAREREEELRRWACELDELAASRSGTPASRASERA